MIKGYLKRYATTDLVIISLLSAGGIATKPFVRVLAQIFTGSVVPIGTVAGVFYMLWIVLACLLVRKRGTAILFGIVESVLVVIFDMLGNRGLANLLVYIGPGITLELVMLLFPRYVSSLGSSFMAGGVANATGAFIVSWVFMRLAAIPLAVTVSLSYLAGGIGGLVAYRIYGVIKRFRPEQTV